MPYVIRRVALPILYFQRLDMLGALQHLLRSSVVRTFQIILVGLRTSFPPLTLRIIYYGSTAIKRMLEKHFCLDPPLKRKKATICVCRMQSRYTQQYRQCTYNVTMRRVHETIVDEEKQ